MDTLSGAEDFTPTLTLPLKGEGIFVTLSLTGGFLLNCVSPVLIQTNSVGLAATTARRVQSAR